jgi:hypothetical protein
MERKQISFEEYLAIGQEGEHEVAIALIKKGLTVLPLYQFENTHPPFILTKDEKVISPDLLVFGKDAFFVEVKTKQQWVNFRGVIETGFDKRVYDHYSKVKNSTGRKVYVVFNHKNQAPCGLYYCEIDEYTRIWDGKFREELKYKAMVFYDFNVLKVLN